MEIGGETDGQHIWDIHVLSSDATTCFSSLVLSMGLRHSLRKQCPGQCILLSERMVRVKVKILCMCLLSVDPHNLRIQERESAILLMEGLKVLDLQESMVNTRVFHKLLQNVDG